MKKAQSDVARRGFSFQFDDGIFICRHFLSEVCTSLK